MSKLEGGVATTRGDQVIQDAPVNRMIYALQVWLGTVSLLIDVDEACWKRIQGGDDVSGDRMMPR